MLSTPNFSVTKRFNARIAIGASISPRRQTPSQGAAQIRPQIEARGFGRRATAYASRYLPSAISVTYLPASVWTGHACLQGKLRSNHSALRSTNVPASLPRDLEIGRRRAGHGHGLLRAFRLRVPDVDRIGAVGKI